MHEKSFAWLRDIGHCDMCKVMTKACYWVAKMFDWSYEKNTRDTLRILEASVVITNDQGEVLWNDPH